MKKIRLLSLLLACLMSVCLLTACEGPAEPPAEDETEPLPTDRSYSVLFIGNSFTQFSNMTTNIFRPMAYAAGYEVTVTSVLQGGYTLESFADPFDEYGRLVEEALSEENYGKYDYVVLQEQSLRPITEPGAFYAAVRTLAERIRAIDATPVLYATWARKKGSADLTGLNLTNESMTWELASAYSAIGEELSIPVAHTGLAFYEVYAYNNYTGIELYNNDLYHPTYSGSFLAAATLLAKMFRVDPRMISYFGSVSVVDAEILMEAAYNAVFATPKIPEKYVKSSEGVTA